MKSPESIRRFRRFRLAMRAVGQHFSATTMSADNEMPQIGPRDIVFECPACHKNLVVDEAAEGLTVDCPGCATKVIVPPKAQKATAAASPPVPPPAGVDPRLLALGSKMKELQTQRTEISNNIAARLNDSNRQMVMLARLESAHQQLMQEWNRVLAELKPGATPAPRTQANFKA
jgi:DNA-directed RNA polymerase subunit RPC12/RpoP